MMLDTVNTQRFEAALAAPTFQGLKDLANQMDGEGLSQTTICERFDLYRRHLFGARRYDAAAQLWVAVECITGYCGRNSWWFDRRLTKDEIDACGCFRLP